MAAVEPKGDVTRLLIDPAGWGHQPAEGDSIAINGCCLTVAEPPTPGQPLAFDAIPETLSRTTVGSLNAGDQVNLEHAVTAATLMGGHFVQGHVDAVGTVERVHTDGEWRVRIQTPREVRPYLAPKGSITVAGVSLTLADVAPDNAWFEVALIPTTLELTTLDALQPGDGVNLEADMLVKAVVSTVERLGLVRS